MASIHLTILNPTSFSHRSRNGAPLEDGQGLPVHLVREQREIMSHVVNAMHVVVAPAFAALGKGVENDVLRLPLRLHEVEDVPHRHAGPFRHTRPTLHTEMASDLFLLRHRLDLRVREFLRLPDWAMSARRLT